jgi:hypothetical protein
VSFLDDFQFVDEIADQVARRQESAQFDGLRDAAVGAAVVLGKTIDSNGARVRSCGLELRAWFEAGPATEISLTTWRRGAFGAAVGDVIPVRYDPADRSKLAIDEPELEAWRGAARYEAIARGEAELARRGTRGATPDQRDAVVLDKQITMDTLITNGVEGAPFVDGCIYDLRVRLDDGSSDNASQRVKAPYHRAAVGDVIPVRYDPAKRSKIEIDVPALDARWAAAARDKLDQAKSQLERRTTELTAGRALGLVLDRKTTGLSKLWDPTTATRCRYELLVGFGDGSTTNSSIKVTGAEHCRAAVGDLLPLHYDPADRSRKPELDAGTLAATQASDRALTIAHADARAQAIARGEAALEPSPIPPTWIPGRGRVNEVRKERAGKLVKCTVTAAVRLIDGTPMYFATFDITVDERRANRIAEGVLFTVRADPQDHTQATISWAEPTPVVLVTDPDIVDPPAHALRDGQPCRIVILAHERAFMRTASGEERFAAKVRVTSDGSEFQVPLHVPDGKRLEDGIELPAKRLADQPQVVAIDWDAAQREAGQN